MTIDYDQLARDIGAAVANAPDALSAMTTAVAALKAQLPYYTWTGIYLMEGDELVLGPYLGRPSPHVRIPLNRGICGAAASQKASIIVDDVNSDSRYLACSLETKSEIVVPIIDARDGSTVLGEIDIDSSAPAAFGARDQALLEAIAASLALRLGRHNIFT